MKAKRSCVVCLGALFAVISPRSARADIRLDKEKGAVLSCTPTPCTVLAQSPFPNGRADSARTEVLTLKDGSRIHWLRVTYGARVWQALAAERQERLLFAGETGLGDGPPGQRRGHDLEIRRLPDNRSVILQGEVSDDSSICGVSNALTSPQMLVPASLTFESVTLDRMPTDGVAIVADAKPLSPFAPSRARLATVSDTSDKASGTALTDGQADTAWWGIRSRDGHGEYVSFALAAVPISEIRLVEPPKESGTVRPKEVGIYFSDKRYVVSFLGPPVPGREWVIRLPEAVTSPCASVVFGRPAVSTKSSDRSGIAEIEFASPMDHENSIASLPTEYTKRIKGSLQVQLGNIPTQPEARLAIAEALIARDSCAEDPFLLGTLFGDDPLTARIESKLQRCGKGASLALETALLGAQKVRAAGLLAMLSPREAVRLLPNSDDLPSVLPALARALRSASDAEVASFVRAAPSSKNELSLLRAAKDRFDVVGPLAFTRVGALFASADTKVRYHLFELLATLVQLRVSGASALLEKELRQEPSAMVRWHALESLREGRATNVLLGQNDENPRVRLAAVLLARHHTEAAAKILPALDDAWSWVRAAGVLSYRDLPKNPAVIQKLGEHTRDPSPLVRESSIEALSTSRSTEAIVAVKSRALDELEVTRVRAKAIHALGTMCVASALDPLTDLSTKLAVPLIDPNEAVLAASAIESLGRMHPADLKKRLGPLLALPKARAARRLAEQAVAQAPGCVTK